MFRFAKKAGLALVVTAGLMGASLSAQAAESYKLDPNHTSIMFIINHLGFSNFQGRFGGVSGELTLDRDNIANSKAVIEVDMTKLNTGVDALNEHLESKDFFNAAKFPKAVFKSTSVKKIDDKTAEMTGDLTLHGVTKPITLTLSLVGDGKNPMSGVPTIGFDVRGTVTRSDYGVTAYVPAVSDTVKLQISTEFDQVK